MRLFELVYCCRLYGESTGFDAALATFWDATGRRADLLRDDHRELTLEWLRRWGCRTLRGRRLRRALRGDPALARIAEADLLLCQAIDCLERRCSRP